MTVLIPVDYYVYYYIIILFILRPAHTLSFVIVVRVDDDVRM